MLFSFNYIPCHSFTVNKSSIDTVDNFKTKVSTIQAIEQNKDWKNMIFESSALAVQVANLVTSAAMLVP